MSETRVSRETDLAHFPTQSREKIWPKHVLDPDPPDDAIHRGGGAAKRLRRPIRPRSPPATAPHRAPARAEEGVPMSRQRQHRRLAGGHRSIARSAIASSSASIPSPVFADIANCAPVRRAPRSGLRIEVALGPHHQHGPGRRPSPAAAAARRRATASGPRSRRARARAERPPARSGPPSRECPRCRPG